MVYSLIWVSSRVFFKVLWRFQLSAAWERHMWSPPPSGPNGRELLFAWQYWNVSVVPALSLACLAKAWVMLMDRISQTDEVFPTEVRRDFEEGVRMLGLQRAREINCCLMHKCISQITVCVCMFMFFRVSGYYVAYILSSDSHFSVCPSARTRWISVASCGH